MNEDGYSLDAVLQNCDEDDAIDIDDWLEEEFSEEEEEEKPNTEQHNSDQSLQEQEISELMVNADIDTDSLDDKEQEMFNIIQEADKIAWEKGEGFTCKFKKLVEKINGIQPGLGFIGAKSNVGKSGFLLEAGYSATEYDNAYSLYFSLDDLTSDLLPRLVASNYAIPINAVRMPETYNDYPSVLDRRREGIKSLYQAIDRFKMIDQSYGDSSIEFIEETIRDHYEYLEDKDRDLFVQIDNFHDIYSRDNNFYDNNEKYEYIARKLNQLCADLNIPIWCTAELKKHDNRRPTPDDIKSATKINYLAKLCLMCYNEVGLEDDNAEVFYVNPDKPGKSPIFEVDVGKNKLSAFKGRLYYEFIPEYGLYTECSEEDIEKYNNKVYQN